MYSVIVGTALAAVGTVGVASAAPAHNATAAPTAHNAAPVRVATGGLAKRMSTSDAEPVFTSHAKRVMSPGGNGWAVRPWDLTAAQRASAVG
ncbi:hypothetical protein SGRIM119S_03435 [Streptomyces griseorubiginosus]